LAPLRTRICLIGPECTGKTTLAESLAVHFDAPWVPEFAREYALRVARPLTVDDVEPIARGQMALEDSVANATTDNRQPITASLTILDTDLISTVVYARHYYGQCPEWIEAEAKARKADLYLLTDIDVPWVADPLRDSATPRESLYEQFAQTLKTYEANVVRLTGNWQQRWEAAIKQLGNPSGRPPARARTPHR
jgi:NadR type nicotinamide-nucleotide adenylyltransferase